MFFKFGKDEPNTEAERKLQQLTELLFPRLAMKVQGEHKYYIDSAADSNLEAVLYDLEDGHNDQVCQSTIRQITDRLYLARRILEVETEVPEENAYYVVDTENRSLDDIEPGEDIG